MGRPTSIDPSKLFVDILPLDIIWNIGRGREGRGYLSNHLREGRGYNQITWGRGEDTTKSPGGRERIQPNHLGEGSGYNHVNWGGDARSLLCTKYHMFILVSNQKNRLQEETELIHTVPRYSGHEGPC